MKADRAVLLYGSHARGDADASSDVDVLVVAAEAPDMDEVGHLVPESCRGPLHVSHYTWDEFRVMSRYGSLFLHHLARESKALLYEGHGENRVRVLLQALGPYQLTERDMSAFRATVDDAIVGLACGLSPCFELAALGGVARHASVLACYVVGRPVFGRDSISKATEVLGIGAKRDTLELAHRFRMFEAGQCERPAQATERDVQHTVEVLRMFLDRLENKVHANAA